MVPFGCWTRGSGSGCGSVEVTTAVPEMMTAGGGRTRGAGVGMTVGVGVGEGVDVGRGVRVAVGVGVHVGGMRVAVGVAVRGTVGACEGVTVTSAT